MMLVQLGILSLAQTESISATDRRSYSCDTAFFFHSDDFINSLAAMIGVLMPPVAAKRKIRYIELCTKVHFCHRSSLVFL